MIFLFLFQLLIGFSVLINTIKTSPSVSKSKHRISTYASRKLKDGKLILSQISPNERTNASSIINALNTGNIEQIIKEFKDVYQKRGGNDPIVQGLIGQLEASV